MHHFTFSDGRAPFVADSGTGGRSSLPSPSSRLGTVSDRLPSLITAKHRLLIAVVVGCRHCQTDRRTD